MYMPWQHAGMMHDTSNMPNHYILQYHYKLSDVYDHTNLP